MFFLQLFFNMTKQTLIMFMRLPTHMRQIRNLTIHVNSIPSRVCSITSFIPPQKAKQFQCTYANFIIK